MGKSLTKEQVLSYLTENNYMWVGGDYITNNSYLYISCVNNHVKKVRFGKLKERKHYCEDCKKEKENEENFNRFIELLNKEGYKFVGGVYKNSSVKMKVSCPAGHIYPISYGEFKRGARCQKCQAKISGIKQRTNSEDVYRMFMDSGYAVVGKYKNSSTKIDVICPEGHEWAVPSAAFKSGTRCRACYLENCGGENHPTWKGGLINVKRHLRQQMYTNWTKKSLEKYGYRCAITGENHNDLQVHHIVGFSRIIEEIYVITGLPKKQNIGEYHQDEIKLLSKTCKELHEKYGLGIPLRKDIHEMFHSIYGKSNNTKEQFEEFKTNYRKLFKLE